MQSLATIAFIAQNARSFSSFQEKGLVPVSSVNDVSRCARQGNKDLENLTVPINEQTSVA